MLVAHFICQNKWLGDNSGEYELKNSLYDFCWRETLPKVTNWLRNGIGIKFQLKVEILTIYRVFQRVVARWIFIFINSVPDFVKLDHHYWISYSHVYEYEIYVHQCTDIDYLLILISEIVDDIQSLSIKNWGNGCSNPNKLMFLILEFPKTHINNFPEKKPNKIE